MVFFSSWFFAFIYNYCSFFHPIKLLHDDVSQWLHISAWQPQPLKMMESSMKTSLDQLLSVSRKRGGGRYIMAEGEGEDNNNNNNDKNNNKNNNKNNLLLSFNWYVVSCSIIISFAGSGLHFLYKLTYCNWIVGIFVAVNESVFEHLKLLVFPIVVIWILSYLLIPPLSSSSVLPLLVAKNPNNNNNDTLNFSNISLEGQMLHLSLIHI